MDFGIALFALHKLKSSDGKVGTSVRIVPLLYSLLPDVFGGCL